QIMSEEVIQNEASSNTSPKKLTFLYEKLMKKKSKSGNLSYPAMNRPKEVIQNEAGSNTLPIIPRYVHETPETIKTIMKKKSQSRKLHYSSTNSMFQKMKGMIQTGLDLNTVKSLLKPNYDYNLNTFEEPETYSMQDDAYIEAQVAEWTRLLVGERFNSQLTGTTWLKYSYTDFSTLLTLKFISVYTIMCLKLAGINLSGFKIITSLYDNTSDTSSIPDCCDSDRRRVSDYLNET
ncbi:9927_t:CDS:2, partial [Cetraspora pellucida]